MISPRRGTSCILLSQDMAISYSPQLKCCKPCGGRSEVQFVRSSHIPFFLCRDSTVWDALWLLRCSTEGNFVCALSHPSYENAQMLCVIRCNCRAFDRLHDFGKCFSSNLCRITPRCDGITGDTTDRRSNLSINHFISVCLEQGCPNRVRMARESCLSLVMSMARPACATCANQDLSSWYFRAPIGRMPRRFWSIRQVASPAVISFPSP